MQLKELNVDYGSEIKSKSVEGLQQKRDESW